MNSNSPGPARIRHYVDNSNAHGQLDYEMDSDGSDGREVISNSDGDSSGSYGTAVEEIGSKCEVCGRVFATVRGLGVHRRRAHPEEANRMVKIPARRKWSPEESRILAKEEMKASAEGVRFINIHLGAILNRTVDSIKGQRKQPSYKVILEQMKEQLRRRSSIALVRRSRRTLSPVVADISVEVDGEGADISLNEEFAFAINETIRELEDGRSVQGNELAAVATSFMNGEVPVEAFGNWLISMFQDPEVPKGPNKKASKNYTGNVKARRKQKYAHVQELYKKDKKALIREILEDDGDVEKSPHYENLFDFWEEIMSTESDANPRQQPRQMNELEALWTPVTLDEVEKAKVDSTSAPGPDGVTAAEWKKIPNKFKVLLFNCFMKAGRLPDELTKARTVFLPKTKGGSLNPGDYRPITMSSVIVRQFHKVLARRLQFNYSFDTRQRAFLPLDGTMENINVLSAALTDARRKGKDLHLASIDLSKAFDSVSYKAIFKVLESINAPKAFIEYVKGSYLQSSTILQFEGKRRTTKVSKGVRQGDPLSPLLFNLTIEKAVHEMDTEVGYDIDGERISGLAYADDIIIMASTAAGLERNIDLFMYKMQLFGLEINTQKSGVVSIVHNRKNHQYKVCDLPKIKYRDEYLPQKSLVEIWKYLGVVFEGVKLVESNCSLPQDLAKLTKAPLKPQQRMYLMRHHIIPKYFHGLVLGRVTSGRLKMLDLCVRENVRKWLHLPHDTPLGYFYASNKDGGLGLEDLLRKVAVSRISRLNKLQTSDSPISKEVFNTDTVQDQLKWARDVLRSVVSPTLEAVQKFWKKCLYDTYDGADLRAVAGAKPSYYWLRNDPSLAAKDFIHFNKLRINAIPSKARSNRGRPRADSNRCRAGCSQIETPYHTIQQCFRTHGGRVMRHDAVVKFMASCLKEKGYMVHVEPRFTTGEGLRKPDIIAVKDNKAVVIDPQITSGSDLIRDYRTKVEKYKSVEGLEAMIKSRYAAREVQFAATTLSYRGIWNAASYHELKQLRISEKSMQKITWLVMRGSWLNWQRFQQMNNMLWHHRRPRLAG